MVLAINILKYKQYMFNRYHKFNYGTKFSVENAL